MSLFSSELPVTYRGLYHSAYPGLTPLWSPLLLLSSLMTLLLATLTSFFDFSVNIPHNFPIAPLHGCFFQLEYCCLQANPLISSICSSVTFLVMPTLTTLFETPVCPLQMFTPCPLCLALPLPLHPHSESESHSVVSSSLRPHGLYSLWNSPGQNTVVGSFSLFQGIFPYQALTQGLLC